MSLIARIQQVELVDHQSWWSQNSGSVLLAIAAVLGAGLAAYVAMRNHKQQLKHDREMRNRDATRNTIDDAIEGIADAVIHTANLGARITSLETARARRQEVDSTGEGNLAAAKAAFEKVDKKVAELIRPTYEAANVMAFQTARLEIRLGNGHPVARCHKGVREALDGWNDSLTDGIRRNRTNAELEGTEERIEDLSRARTDFDTACHGWMNE